MKLIKESVERKLIESLKNFEKYNFIEFTCVCRRVKPLIHKIWPARGFLSESIESKRSSPRCIASVYSSGWPRPHL